MSTYKIVLQEYVGRDNIHFEPEQEATEVFYVYGCTERQARQYALSIVRQCMTLDVAVYDMIIEPCAYPPHLDICLQGYDAREELGIPIEEEEVEAPIYTEPFAVYDPD